MELLPLEVLERIFYFLDGSSFSYTRRVCKTWNSIMRNRAFKNSCFKTFCFREIPIYIMEELLAQKLSKCDDIDWLVVYKKWFTSRMIVASPYSTKKIQVSENNSETFLLDRNPVTCIRLSGSWVITGHSNGVICVWNAQSGDLKQKLIKHLRIINDIALVDLLNLGSYIGHEDLPWCHHHMITVSKDSYINITLLLEPMADSDSNISLSTHGDEVKQIRIFGDIFAVRSVDNNVSLWKMKIVRKPFFNMEATQLQKIPGPQDYILSIGLWYNKVQCITNSGKLKVLEFQGNEWIEKRVLRNSSSASGIPQAIVAVTDAFICRWRAVIMLTSDQRIILSTNESDSRHFFLTGMLGTTVVSLAFKSTILALGGENGKLFIYYVFSDKHLVCLDISKPDFQIQLSEASIISMDILFSTDGPMVAASTNECLYVVKWMAKSTKH